MKNAIKKTAAFFLASAMLMQLVITALAQQPLDKDEVIYANLNYDGSLSEIYVVNIFDRDKTSSKTDYGAYTSIRNLTTTDMLELDADRITIPAGSGKFYYQGNLENARLPWRVNVNYTLDGAAIGGENLAGKSGHLNITIHLAMDATADSIYSEHFALQATVTLDADNCKNILAPSATIANVGSDKQLAYIVMPGKEKTIEISADVKNFEMAGMQVNGIPLSLDIDDPDTTQMKDKVYELQDGAKDLDDGAVKLDDATAELVDGVITLKDGSTDMEDGAYDLYDGAKDMKKGVSDLSDGASALKDGASKLDHGFKALSSSSIQLKSGIYQSQTAMVALLQSLGIAISLPGTPTDPLDISYLLQVGHIIDSSFDAAVSQIDASSMQLERSLQYVASVKIDSGSEDTVADKVEYLENQITYFEATRASLAQYQQANALSNGMLSYMAAAEQLGAGHTEVYGGLITLRGGIQELYDATEDLTGGTKELYDGAVDLNEGVQKLYDGAIQLKDGTVELADGTQELRDKSYDMDSEIDDKINDILNEYRSQEFDMVSFVSTKNTAVHSVQFVMKTADISIDDDVATQAETDQKATLWQKIRDLFSFNPQKVG